LVSPVRGAPLGISRAWGARATGGGRRDWPLHDIVITNLRVNPGLSATRNAAPSPGCEWKEIKRWGVHPIHIHIYVYISVSVCIYVYSERDTGRAQLVLEHGVREIPEGAAGIGLYTILLLPILQGVWHAKGRSRGGRISANSRAIVLQQCGQCRRAGRMKGRLIRAQTTRSKRMSCKGQRRDCRRGPPWRDKPELWRGATGLCAHVRACAGAAESLHTYIHTYMMCVDGATGLNVSGCCPLPLQRPQTQIALRLSRLL